jgi:hypothetical protein
MSLGPSVAQPDFSQSGSVKFHLDPDSFPVSAVFVASASEQAFGLHTLNLVVSDALGVLAAQTTKADLPVGGPPPDELGVLVLTQWTNTQQAVPGQEIEAHVALNNATDQTLTNVSLWMNSPVGFEYVPGSAHYTRGHGVAEQPCDDMWYNRSNFGRLAPGDSVHIVYRVRVTDHEDGDSIWLVYSFLCDQMRDSGGVDGWAVVVTPSLQVTTAAVSQGDAFRL